MNSTDRAALTRTLQAIYREIGAMGEQVYRRILPGGRLPTRNGGTGTSQGAEPPLGNPDADGYVLSSTTGGARSWVPRAGGAGGGMVPLDPTTAEGDLIYRHLHAGTAVKVGFIGDSITRGAMTTTPAPSLVSAALTAHGLTVTAYNQGQDGAVSADWVPGAGSGYLTAAKAAFATGGVRLVHYMIGTNDSKVSAGQVAAATYRANVLSTVADLVAAGYLVVLAAPPYTIPGSYTADFDATSNARQLAYAAELLALCNGATTFLGDTTAYAYFLAHPARLPEGVHPDDTGTAALAAAWSAALDPLVRALARELALDRLPIGTSGQALVVSGGYPAWGTPALADSGVAAGTYTLATVTVDAKGRVTAASSGAGGGGTIYSWEPLVTGNAAEDEVTLAGVAGDPVWFGHDFIMVGSPYTPS